jgi:hypothetical protein
LAEEDPMNRAILPLFTVAVICVMVVAIEGIFLLRSSLLVHPGGPHEELCPGYTRLNSPTNMSFNVLNCGSYPVNALSYYVKDPAGNLYAQPNWSVPIIPLMANVTLFILIDGNAFTFQHGSPYTINLNTQRVHYTFTVTP